MRQCADLRRWADALAALGSHWRSTKPAQSASGKATLGPEFAASGVSDLNAPVAVATAGILFMEGETTPFEIGEVLRELTELAERCKYERDWVSEKMDVGWARETPLLASPLVVAGYHRCLTLMCTELHSALMGIVGRLVRAAIGALADVNFDDVKALRADLPICAEKVLAAASLIEQAVALRVTAAAELSRSDRDWGAYIDALESHLTMNEGMRETT